jgi:mannose-6-phosphate isomerase-like protein (cupin superfamily)
MKNRRKFLHIAAVGFLCPSLLSFAKLNLVNKSREKGIVRQPEEGETYFVRENTPITIKVSKTSDNIDSMSICSEEILPGNGISMHKHMNEDEMFVFHKGSGIFLLNDEEIPVGMGATAFVPKGTWHGLKNTGTELLVFTFGYTPAGFEDFFRHIGTLKGIAFKAKTKEEITLLAGKYGMLYK